MDLPMKLILINQQNYKGLIKLDTVLFADSILLSFELYNFKTQLTSLLIESFETYVSNREFIKTLPIERYFEIKLTLTQVEEYYQYLSAVHQQSKDSQYLNTIELANLRLWVDNSQIFSMVCFFQGFILSYSNLQINIAIFREQQIQKEIINNPPKSYVPEKEEYNKEITENCQQIIIDNFPTVETDTIFLNDILKLSPSNIVTYFISKYIYNLLSNDQIDIIEKAIDDKNNITILLQPLVNLDYLKLTDRGIYNFIDILSSFDFTIDEYLNKIKTLLKGLLYISKRNNIHDFNLSLKVIELLIFIYSLKSDVNQINIISNNEKNVNNIMISIITNSAIDYIFKTSSEFQNCPKISFFHPASSKQTANNLKDLEIKNLLAKEIYLLEIDKMQFLQTVLSTSQTLSKKGDIKLILDNEKILNIDRILNSPKSNIKNNHLDYNLLEVSEKQFKNNKIITSEYYKILKIGNTMFQNIQSNSEEDLIISKYYSGIEQCLKQISNAESQILLISTLNILYQFIRPNIENISVQIELFILYRIVIPFIYDIFNISSFKDYFN